MHHSDTLHDGWSRAFNWDLSYDVIVAGYGYAGAMAAISAADEGATVGLFEKMPHPGGNSILSGGGFIFAKEFEPALTYLRHICDGTTDDEVLIAFARGMVDLPAIMNRLVDVVGTDIYLDPMMDAAYPFPGAETLRKMHVSRNGRFPGFDWLEGERAGATAFWVMKENVEQRDNITVYHHCRVRRLLVDRGEIVGCEAEVDGSKVSVGSRRATVLCTGGFEHNTRLLKHYVASASISAVSPGGNTGDGILMGQKVGGALWHMWHLHGSYGFKLPESGGFAIRHAAVGPRNEERAMWWILVNRKGVRFMNEYPPAPQDTPIRNMLEYDPDGPAYSNIPAFLIFDEDGRQVGPLGRPVMSDPAVSYVWSKDNSREIEKGYIKKAGSIDEIAERLGMETTRLAQTVGDWNVACDTGRDDEFGRPSWSMLPIRRPPYYYIDVHPLLTNTQGGLVHDAEQRVLDPFSVPIPRLYKAGEMGSIFGHLYLLGGNNSECLIGGRTAGVNAAAEGPIS